MEDVKWAAAEDVNKADAEADRWADAEDADKCNVEVTPAEDEDSNPEDAVNPEEDVAEAAEAWAEETNADRTETTDGDHDSE